MIVDRETLADLEIFACRSGGQPVIAYLDRCRTEGGADELRTLIAKGPGHDVPIRELQEVTRFFYDHGQGLTFPVDRKAARALEQYLASNFTGIDLPLSWSRHLQSFILRYRCPEMYQFCHSGIQETMKTLAAAVAFVTAVTEAGESPPAVRALAGEFLRLWQEIGGPGLAARCQDPSTTEVFVIDHLLRSQNRDNLRRMLRLLYRLDAHVGMAIATREHGLVFPTIVEGPDRRIEIEGLYHLFLARPVRNDFRLDGAQNLLFLTGPNMAGKSTYMKAVGIAVILAHIGMGVPAAAMSVSPIDYLFCELSMHDDIRLGISGFLAEVLRVQRILQFCAGRFKLLVIIDEIFKGTNVHDAYACSKLVITGLARLRDHFFLISSHLLELEADLRPFRNIRFRCFDAALQNGALSFSYRIADGVSPTRVGLQLLAEHGIIDMFRELERTPSPAAAERP
ncbi:MAG: DNA mismatch repair protein MutS [Candidatus Ozemobacter sibiricus]|jgi:DNA mismatch repair ATPase MutS|uniref:DNA mismatch repair protein MutS n=1 Tax=Candidatus Ozemobacter sibiricus TaxID=2268124 RepID=A0A367ZLJ4_9BACT|nr:MAG: DNA mismatch repair protein MutS [Candidatus Ozemobacter sibiricus]